MTPTHACVHLALCDLKGGQAVICTTALWLSVGTSTCQRHNSREVRTLSPWLQVRAAVGSGPGRRVPTPSPLGAGDVACVCTLLCINPLALTPQPLTGYLLWGGHCEERREDVTRALTCKTVSSWRKRSRKLGDEGTKKIMLSVREGKGDPASSRGGSGT